MAPERPAQAPCLGTGGLARVKGGPSMHSPPSQHRTGWIEVVCGSMFSGKTEELLRRIKRARLARQPVSLFKPRVDNRYDEVKVVSHEGLDADAIPVASAEELLARVPDDAR